MKFVDMNEYFVSDEQHKIIGTYALATCSGILLYDRKNKVGAVGHVNSHWFELCVYMSCSIKAEEIEYLVISGYDRVKLSDFEIKDNIENFFKNCNILNTKFIPFKTEAIVHLNEKTESYEFAFDVESGNFISDINEIENNIGGNCL